MKTQVGLTHMMRVFTVATLFLSSWAYADPMLSRNEKIVVGVGTDVNYHFKRYAELLAQNGRKVSNVKVIARYGTGGIAGLGFTHVAKQRIPANCQWSSQDATVNFFGDVYAQANQILFYLKTSNKKVIDMEIAGTFGTGKPGTIRIYFCD